MTARIMRTTNIQYVLAMALVLGAAQPARGVTSNEIDVHHSKLTVRAFKSGIFSSLAHDHEIDAPLAAGTVDTLAPSVELRFESGALRVLDPDLAANKRADVQRTMLGPKVLDTARYPEIRFRSSSVEKSGAAQWRVRGTLTLHGQSHPLELTVTRAGRFYRGTATLRQTEFGIKPVRIAGGTVRVKDEVRVEFEIAAAS